MRKLLASLEVQEEVEEFIVEVFVADNDPSRREALQVCNDLERNYRWPIACSIVTEPGISAARNAILEEGRARQVDFIAMLDDDEIAASGWLAEILRVQGRFQADAVAGPMHYLFTRDTPAAVIKCGVFVTPDQPEGILPVIFATPNVLLDCAALARSDWPQFNISFGLTGGEDREFFLRLRKLGFRFAWAPTAETFEAVATSRTRSSFILRRSFSNGNADIRIRRVHRDLGGTAASLGKAAVLLATAPFGAVLLLSPSKRLWMLAKWARSIGKLAAVVGVRHEEYAAARVNESA